jgi:hypothetical protein
MRRRLGWDEHEVIGVVFGLYATQLRALERFEKLICGGMRQGVLQRLVCLGGDRASAPRQLSEWGNRIRPRGRWEVLGPRSAEEVGEILSSCDFHFAPHPGQILEKSGGFIACAFAGLGVLAYGLPTERDSDGPPVLRAESWDWQDARSPEVLGTRAALKRFAYTNYTWETIARQAVEHMESLQQHGPPKRTRAAILLI